MTKYIIALVLLVSICLLFPYGHLSSESSHRYDYFTIVDEEDNIITKTANTITVGDIYITDNNRQFKVIDVKDKMAYAEYETTIEMEEILKSLKSHLQLDIAEQTDKRPIAIFHTHSAESYVPSDGEDSISPRGGIIDVGEAFTEFVEERNVPAVHSDQSHDPHDARSYDRSRSTAVTLLRENNAIALVDIHRDATPAEEYTTTIDDEDVARIQLVVGRRNADMSANRNFALQLKAAADDKYESLVKGILFADGTYNQDLAPRSILIEAGTHTNTKEQAIRGLELFVDSTVEVMAATTALPGEDAATRNTALWIIGIVTAGILFFLILNKENVKDFIDSLRRRT